MIDAVNGVGARDLRALYALYTAALKPLALVPTARAAGAAPAASVGTDRYTPSVGGAASALTYNRFGRLDGAAPTATPAVAFPGASVQPASAPTGLTPAQVARAYGTGATGLTGAGQTIAVVSAFNSPTVSQDLAVFDRTFGLPAANLRVIGQSGGAPAGAADTGWSVETALDVEWAHATAPGANILLVEAGSADVGDLAAAVNTARNQPGVSVLSMSFGTSEFPQELRLDSTLTTPAGHTPIAFVAASGDSGAGTLWPAVSPNVLSVGGTTLFTGPGGSYVGELGWPGSGGGISLYETEPAYQLGVQSTGRRTTPDVAYDADPQPGFSIYQGGTWQTVGGTSAGAPQWAGLVALADQQRAARGLGPLGQVQTPLYNLPAADFHDVVAGSNGFLAGTGYDFVTGLGSPVANRVVTGLATPQVAASFHPPFHLQSVSVASLLFPRQAPSGGLGWWWGV
ncbi:MAG TPA: S53 family peptidase [Gemmataceae bacterium]|nr:S53 family peptidase [Gemmataceae bacterium]